jgi:hypothetical protein
VPFHQELLVEVMGGSETTPTEGAVAEGAAETTGADAAVLALAAWIAAMARLRLRSRTS